MDDSKKTTVNVGGGFFGMLGIAFIILKLCHVIDWSWWLVLLPIYGPVLLWAVILLIITIIAFTAK